MRRKTSWAMLTIVAFVLPMLVIPTSYADRYRKKIALKQERVKRSAQENAAARKQLKRVDLTPARGRTKAEQERLAAKKEAAREEGGESHAAEMWPREMPPPGILSQRHDQMSAMGRLAAGTGPKLSR